MNVIGVTVCEATGRSCQVYFLAEARGRATGAKRAIERLMGQRAGSGSCGAQELIALRACGAEFDNAPALQTRTAMETRTVPVLQVTEASNAGGRPAAGRPPSSMGQP